MADVFEVFKRFFTTPTSRFLISEADPSTNPEAKIIYDGLEDGDKAEGLTFTIPVSTVPPCPEGQQRDPTTGQCVPIPPPPPPPGQAVKASVALVTASKYDPGKDAFNVLDQNFESRWSAPDIGDWIEFTFDRQYDLKEVRLTGYHYDKTYTFEINGQSFTCPAGRTPNTLIPFDISALNLRTDTVRIIGKGNNTTTYISLREVEFYGVPLGTVPPPPECPPGQHWDVALEQCVPDTPEPPPPPPSQQIRMVAFADNDTTQDAEDVSAAIMKVLNVSAYLFVGDGPYSTSGTKWVNMMKKYWNTPELVSKLIVSQGNHEHKESESDQTEKDIEAWLPHLNKSPEGLDWTSAQQIGNVYVISGNTQDMDIEFKRDQYNWLMMELEKANQLRAAGQIDWIVYMAHKPFFTLKSSHSPYTAVRNLYKDLFRSAQVDFVLHGHNHNTQLWFPMVPNASDANGEGQQLFTYMADGKTFDFTKDHGWLGIVTGHAGHEWNKINDSGNGVKNVMHYRDSGKFGLTLLEFNGKKANVKSIDTAGVVHYEYNVSREGSGGTNPPPPEECPPGQHRDPQTGQCVPDNPPPPPPPPGGQLDEFGIRIPSGFKLTGKFVDQKVGGDPAGNGQRYSVNHKYKNYLFTGYYKSGTGQEKWEVKWDGPNHGSCTDIDKGCVWLEPSIDIKTGKAALGGEWPHPKNHNNLPAPSAKSLNANTEGKWLGILVWGYESSDGFRVVGWAGDKNPFTADGKPANNWELLCHEIDRGQITSNEMAKREIPPPQQSRGIETEVRMHGESKGHGKPGGTDFKWSRVYEIEKPNTDNPPTV